MSERPIRTLVADSHDSVWAGAGFGRVWVVMADGSRDGPGDDVRGETGEAKGAGPGAEVQPRSGTMQRATGANEQTPRDRVRFTAAQGFGPRMPDASQVGHHGRGRFPRIEQRRVGRQPHGQQRLCEAVNFHANRPKAQQAVVLQHLDLAGLDQPGDGGLEVADTPPRSLAAESLAHPCGERLCTDAAEGEHKPACFQGSRPEPAKPLARRSRPRSNSSRGLRLSELAEERLELGDCAGSHDATAAAMDPLERDLDRCAIAPDNAGQVGEQVPGGEQGAAAGEDAERGRNIGDVARERADPDPGVAGEAEGKSAGRRSSADRRDATGDSREVRGEVTA